MVKYNADSEITIAYEKEYFYLSFFIDMLIFIYILSNLNIFWFISIRFDWFDKWLIGI